MAACLAGELRLSLPVGPLAMTAGRTGPRRIPRVDRHHGDPGQFRLVRHEAVELRERPSREPVVRSVPRAVIRSRMPERSSRAIPRSVPLALSTIALLMAWLTWRRNRASLPDIRPSFFFAPWSPCAGVVSAGGCASAGPARRPCRSAGCRRSRWRCRRCRDDPDEVFSRDRGPVRDVDRHQQEPSALHVGNKNY